MELLKNRTVKKLNSYDEEDIEMNGEEDDGASRIEESDGDDDSLNSSRSAGNFALSSAMTWYAINSGCARAAEITKLSRTSSREKAFQNWLSRGPQQFG